MLTEGEATARCPGSLAEPATGGPWPPAGETGGRTLWGSLPSRAGREHRPGPARLPKATPEGRPPAAWWVAVRVYCRGVVVCDDSRPALDWTVRARVFSSLLCRGMHSTTPFRAPRLLRANARTCGGKCGRRWLCERGPG